MAPALSPASPGPREVEPSPHRLFLLLRLAHGPHDMAKQQGTVCSGPCACHPGTSCPSGSTAWGPGCTPLSPSPRVLLHRAQWLADHFFWNLLGIFGKTAAASKPGPVLGLSLVLNPAGVVPFDPCPQGLSSMCFGPALLLQSFLVLTFIHYHLVVRHRGFMTVGLAQRYCNSWKGADDVGERG